MITTEHQNELDLIAKFGDLKCTNCPDIHDRVTLGANFRVECRRIFDGEALAAHEEGR